MEHQRKIEHVEDFPPGYEKLQISRAKLREGILLFHITLKRTFTGIKISLELRLPIG
jgi:hypothetical protein